MISMSYTSGRDGEVVDLGTPKSFGDPSGLRGRAWSYELKHRSAANLRYAAKEASFSYIGMYPNADELRGIADADIASEKPGTLEIDGWCQTAYIVSHTPAAYQHGTLVSSLGTLLLDGFWWRERSRHFVTGLAEGGLDHDYDHDYDLSYSSGSGSVEVSTRLGARPRITFYGPCTNPYVTIGANRYEVDSQVLSGSKLVLDATGSAPTAKLVDNQGNETSVFSKAVRTGGQGGGSYAFEPLPYGTLDVSWSGSFAFEVAWRELETEPPWSR